MTVSIGDVVDGLRLLWVACGMVWIGYAWLHRVPYRRALFGVLALVALDFALHLFADFAEQPGSRIPSDFALYSVMMLLAGTVGLGAASLYARWREMRVQTVIDAALVCAIAGGIGGRAYYVALNWNYYSENTDAITDLAQGGLAMHGALFLGCIALLGYALVTRNSFWDLADSAAIGLTLAQSIGWYGAFLTHTHYGIALDAPAPTGMFAPLAQILRAVGYNFVQDLPDAYNLIAFRIPVQLIYTFFFGGLFLYLVLSARGTGRMPGSRFMLYLVLASAANFIFGFWRGDESVMWNGLRPDQWIDVGLVLFGVALLRAETRRARENPLQRRMVRHA